MKQNRRVFSTPAMRSSVVGVLPPPSSLLMSEPLPTPPTRPVATRALLKPSCVQLSRRVFALWWFALCAVHSTALSYHARITKFYWLLPGSPVGEMIELYDLSIPHSHSRLVAVANVGIAAVHAVAVLRMVRNSVRARQLVFFVDVPEAAIDGLHKRRPHRGRLGHLVLSVRRLFAYRGPFGVEGEYFDALLHTTELVETLLQTYQASRVDSLVARRWLSRVYVAVLVFNCWSVPLIHVLYRTQVAKKRLLSLMCDCLQDLFSSVVMPGAVFFQYVADYDPLTHSIERTRWYDDRWLVQLWSEHEMVVIASWVDAVSRLVFALGLLLSLEGIKQLLRAETVRDQPPRPTLIKRISRQLLHLVETATSNTEGDGSSSTRRLSTAFRRRYTASLSLLDQIQRLRWAAIFHAALALWGVVVVAIHLAAEATHASATRVVSCPIQFGKWLGSAPVCLLLDINCDALEIHGAAADLERQWEQIDTASVFRVVLRHCPALAVPRSIQEFRNLKSIKVYNSTVETWDATGGFSSRSFSALRSLQFIRVNYTAARLPPGLYSSQFPRGVRIIEFCDTNLHDIPPDLVSVWPNGLRLGLESSAFTSVPAVALQLLPSQLSMSGNPITSIPPELFQSPGIRRVGVARSLVTQWPANVSEATPTLRQVSIVGSRVRGPLPVWMGSVVERAQAVSYLVVALFAGDTPLCEDPDDRPDTLIRSVTCRSGQDDVSYPLAFEDLQSALRH